MNKKYTVLFFLWYLNTSFYSFVSASELLLKVPHNFGKTHFIAGFPHELYQAKMASAEQPEEASSDIVVLFSPDDDVQNFLVDLINKETKSIKIAIFCFTADPIAQALLNAHKRGVSIEIIADPGQLKDRYSKITLLQKAGIKVFEYDPNYIADMRSNNMHHKFVVFGADRVWTGSFNFTQAANKRNQENVLVVRDTTVAKAFNKQFECIKTRCVGYKKVAKNMRGRSQVCTAGRCTTCGNLVSVASKTGKSKHSKGKIA